MSPWHRWLLIVATGLTCQGLWALPAPAVSFTTSYTTGGTWRTIYAQGFKAGATPNPDPGHAIGDTVHLDRFQFFKSGVADTAADFQLAIVNTYFLNLDTFTVNSPELVGLSTNTIASTAAMATGDPITFEFDQLPLLYGVDTPDELLNNNYTAIFVNRNGDALTPVLVSALSVDYLPNQNEIATDYGSVGNYFLSTSNYHERDAFGLFLKTFGQTLSGRYGDSNFVAYFDLPEGIDGDFNGSGTVDAADYVLWKNGGPLQNDPTPGVQPEDYDVWKAHFGAGGGNGAGRSTVVPEPSALLLAILAGLGATPSRSSGARRQRSC